VPLNLLAFRKSPYLPHYSQPSKPGVEGSSPFSPTSCKFEGEFWVQLERNLIRIIKTFDLNRYALRGSFGFQNKEIALIES
jgi:hypothetical protein